MQLNRIKIDGFKNVINADVVLSDETILVSLNNLGKSNFLKGVIFGASFIKNNEEAKILMLENKAFYPLNKTSFNKDYCFEIEGTSDGFNFIYSYIVSWGDKNIGIKNETLRIKKISQSQKYETVINRNGDEILYKSSAKGRCNTIIDVSKYNLVVNRLLVDNNLYYIDVIKAINKMNIYVEDKLDVKQMFNVDPIIVKNIGNALFSPENLPRVLYKLKKTHPDKYNLIEDTFKSLFPNVNELVLQEVKIGITDSMEVNNTMLMYDSVYILSIIDSNLAGPISFEEMSDGTKRLLVLLTRIVLGEMSGVCLIAIEEPENSINANLLNALVQSISQLIGNTKIIFTTHSTYLISYLINKNIYVGYSDDCGGALFNKIINKKLINDSTEVEQLSGDYLFSVLNDIDDLKEYI